MVDVRLDSVKPRAFSSENGALVFISALTQANKTKNINKIEIGKMRRMKLPEQKYYGWQPHEKSRPPALHIVDPL